MSAPDPTEAIRAYHARSKHHPHRFAASLGYLDWDSQPDPFRRYEGAPLRALPLSPVGDDPPYEPSFVHGRVPPRPLSALLVGQLFQDGLGLSAWKQAGEARWALRVDPSSGNLHPTEGYLVAPAIPGLTDAPGVHHYQPYLHALEERTRLSPEEWAALGLPEGSLLLGLSSIWWREAWKYGERAWRYCQHDLGHCLGTLILAAAALGWRARLVDAATDEERSLLLGMSRPPPERHPSEHERAEALLVVTPGGRPPVPWTWRPRLPGWERPGRWTGVAAPLSTDHQDWPAIAAAHQAGLKRRAGVTVDEVEVDSGLICLSPEEGGAPFGLRRIIHQRRSAVDMDGRTGMQRGAFLQILRKLLPGHGQIPWSSLPGRPRVHPVFFVHRVADLAPGLYLLARDPAAVDDLRAHFRPSFAWKAVAPGLPLYALQEADVRATAQGLSCGQEIAGAGCFAVAMLGELRGALLATGPEAWRRLHWEAGLIGQILYLEAEASGLRGTGIGCFFDDPTHQLLLRPEAAQEDRLVDLYHFTVGGPVEDERLQTLPPYAHRA